MVNGVKILIVGGSGMIGRKLADRLAGPRLDGDNRTSNRRATYLLDRDVEEPVAPMVSSSFQDFD